MFAYCNRKDSSVVFQIEPSEDGLAAVQEALVSALATAPNAHGDASASVDGARKNKQQRCSVCKGAGHKSRTCTFRPGPGLNTQPSPRLRLSF